MSDNQFSDKEFVSYYKESIEESLNEVISLCDEAITRFNLSKNYQVASFFRNIKNKS